MGSRPKVVDVGDSIGSSECWVLSRYGEWMEHGDHIALLRIGVTTTGGVWADFGAGRGAFTLALADLLGPGAEIYAIDRDRGDLRRNADALAARFHEVVSHYVVADFTRAIDLAVLDGLVMANSLHFQPEQRAVVELLRGYLRPGGRMLIVEYNIGRGNFAVPHPVPFERWERLAAQAGFGHTELLTRRPSRTFAEIYSAASW